MTDSCSSATQQVWCFWYRDACAPKLSSSRTRTQQLQQHRIQSERNGVQASTESFYLDILHCMRNGKAHFSNAETLQADHDYGILSTSTLNEEAVVNDASVRPSPLERYGVKDGDLARHQAEAVKSFSSQFAGHLAGDLLLIITAQREALQRKFLVTCENARPFPQPISLIWQ